MSSILLQIDGALSFEEEKAVIQIFRLRGISITVYKDDDTDNFESWTIGWLTEKDREDFCKEISDEVFRIVPQYTLYITIQDHGPNPDDSSEFYVVLEVDGNQRSRSWTSQRGQEEGFHRWYGPAYEVWSGEKKFEEYWVYGKHIPPPHEMTAVMACGYMESASIYIKIIEGLFHRKLLRFEPTFMENFLLCGPSM